MKDWIQHRLGLMNADMSNVIIFPSERRQNQIDKSRNQIEESERQKEKMRGDAPLIARSSDHLSKSSKFPPALNALDMGNPSNLGDSDGEPPNAA
jgi:hypothetical protein